MQYCMQTTALYAPCNRLCDVTRWDHMSEDDKHNHKGDHSAQEVREWGGKAKVALDWSLEVEHTLYPWPKGRGSVSL